ncbi:metallophosphoesterase [Chitinophaga niabensis]|uniref:metallophosphoesterase n=1 Tax=Chitinophaga niabensis TaxID=536979 RepID=UPI0031BB8EC0
MKRILIFLPMLTCMLSVGKSDLRQKDTEEKESKIIVEVELPKDFKRTSILLSSIPADYVRRPTWQEHRPEIKGDFVKWTIFSDSARIVDLRRVLGRGSQIQFYEPGDSIHIDLKNVKPVYSGRNADKFIMLEEMFAKTALLAAPRNPRFSRTDSLQDYLEWSNYLNAKEAIMDEALTAYQDRLTPIAFDHVKAETIVEIEYERLMKFGALAGKLIYEGAEGKLGDIFDSTANNKHAQWLHAYTGKVGNAYYLYDFVRKSVQRQYNFNTTQDILQTTGRKILYADLAKKIYKGRLLEECMMYLLTSQGLKEHTLKENSPEIDTLLTAYYAQPEYPDYKQYVRDYEKRIRRAKVSADTNAPDFSLQLLNGQWVDKQLFKRKVVILNFVMPDSKDCDEMNNALEKVMYNFEKDTNVVLLSIVVDQDKRGEILRTLTYGSYSNKLQTRPLDKASPISKYYCIYSFPQVFLLDGEGKFVYNGNFDTEHKTNKLPDPRKDGGKQLLKEIYGQLAFLNDGPYITHTKDSVITIVVRSQAVIRDSYTKSGTVQLKVQTDVSNEEFPVVLKKLHKEEPSQYARPEKLFVLSDIEGNFDALRKLLQANNVIDDRYNWIFGAGHLVFAGDMFDRGKQVTECLWLIYSLEQKAKDAGGYVHFILGNHEIMNLNGDLRYLQQKYRENVTLMKLPYQNLYDENSELGMWLRTKNIMEKIGDLLFVHGGISREMNALDISISEINSMARPFYSKDSLAIKSSNKAVASIYGKNSSPFWNREYYHPSRKTSEAILDSTLRKFDVSRVITGHTIVAKEISSHYNGRVINIDTKHSNGESEALLIEGNSYYSVDSRGKRELLFNKASVAKK